MKATIPGRVANTTQLRFHSRQGWFDLQSTGSFWGRDRIPAKERPDENVFGPRPRCQHRPGGSRGWTEIFTISDKGCGDTTLRNEQSTSLQRAPTLTTLPKQSPTLLGVSVSQAEPCFARRGSPRAGRQGTTDCFLLTPPQEPAQPPPPCWAGRRDTDGPPSRPRTPRRAPAPEGAPS